MTNRNSKPPQPKIDKFSEHKGYQPQSSTVPQGLQELKPPKGGSAIRPPKTQVKKES